jgi:hypothetical protein
MIERFKELMHTNSGQVLISIILGFGLATMFKKVCRGKNCFVVKGPNPSEVAQNYYKIADRCYKYAPIVTPCRDGSDKKKQS